MANSGHAREGKAPRPSSIAGAARLAAVGALLMLLAGCSDVAYYWQAGVGQWDVLRRRRPIAEVLADPAVGEPTKQKLKLVQTAQAYGGTHLALPEGGRFRYYADLERAQVSWLVVASEAFQIKEVKQCYLIVGCLGYRGFFRQEDARGFAGEMTHQGYDTLVRPVRAYSTLGWFDDPVLNTYIGVPDAQLVSTIFHEQAHRVVFIPGDTAFNESFATFVAEEGVRRFLSERGSEGQAQLERYQARTMEQRRFRAIVLAGRARLERFYASHPPPAERGRSKARLFTQMREDYQKVRDSFKILRYDSWFDMDLNNAHLVGFSQYNSWVEAFRALLAQQGGDWPGFHQAARELARLPETERKTRLKTLNHAHLAKY